MNPYIINRRIASAARELWRATMAKGNKPANAEHMLYLALMSVGDAELFKRRVIKAYKPLNALNEAKVNSNFDDHNGAKQGRQGFVSILTSLRLLAADAEHKPTMLEQAARFVSLSTGNVRYYEWQVKHAREAIERSAFKTLLMSLSAEELAELTTLGELTIFEAGAAS